VQDDQSIPHDFFSLCVCAALEPEVHVAADKNVVEHDLVVEVSLLFHIAIFLVIARPFADNGLAITDLAPRKKFNRSSGGP
jgi:hypothetical protein